MVVHHGPWSSGPNGNNARLHEAGIIPLLAAHKVDLIISGHDHIYERGWAEGLAYLVSGGGGAPLDAIASRLPQARKVESVRHFVDVSVSAASMQIVAVRSDGSTIERCALSKSPGGWDCDGIAPAAASSANRRTRRHRLGLAARAASSGRRAGGTKRLSTARRCVRVRRSSCARPTTEATRTPLGNATGSVDTASMVLSRWLVTIVVLAAVGTGACTTYRDQLARGQRAFEQNDHDRTLAILRDLEPDMKRLTAPEQAEYAYLRGMSDYRIGYKSDARHWLAVAKAYEESSPGVLPVDWKTRTNEALDVLNGVVFSEGTGGLSTSRRSESDDAKELAAKDGKKGRHDVSKDAPTDDSSSSPSPRK